MGYGYGRGRGYGYGRRGRWGWESASGVQPLPQLPPPPPGVLRVVAAVDSNQGLESSISTRFARAPFLAIIDIAGGRVANLNIIPNTYASGAHGVGVAIAQWILTIRASVTIGPPLGPNASMVLQQAGVRMVSVRPGTPLRTALRIAGLTMV